MFYFDFSFKRNLYGKKAKEQNPHGSRGVDVDDQDQGAETQASRIRRPRGKASAA